jgi:hypothetical protein
MPMVSIWLLDVLGCCSYVCFLCLLLVDNQVIHLVPNKRKASKANQRFVSIIHMTEATNLKLHMLLLMPMMITTTCLLTFYL